MRSIWSSLPVTLVLLGCATGGAATTPEDMGPARQAVRQGDDWCDEGRYRGEDERYCEVREWTLPADRDVIAVDASPNGGVQVEGWDRNEILLQAKVQARGRSERDARGIADEVEIETGRHEIRARGPRTGRREGWSVSYRLRVPRRSNLDLESTNGGITIRDVSGTIEFRTTNGGIRLAALSGDVRGSTTNGGVRIELAGDRWEGHGLDVRTTNGSVRIWVPDGYAANLESGTTNGSMRIDFPITVQGRIDREITAQLGGGGQTIRAKTTNGSVVISRG